MYGEQKTYTELTTSDYKIQDHGEIKQAPILREYGRLGKNIAIVREQVDELERRLTGVLRSEPGGRAIDPERPEEMVCEFAGSIRSDARRIEELGHQITDILSRLEL